MPSNITRTPIERLKLLYDIFVGIPSYNAASSVGQVIEDVEQNSKVRTIILIDDASKDATPNLLATKRSERLYHKRNETNRGYGGTVKRIFSEFKQLSTNPDDLLIILHADGQTPPDEIPHFIETYERNRPDIVLGSRMLAGFKSQWRNRPLLKIVGDLLLTRLQNLVYGLSLSSYATGYRAFRRAALDVLNYEVCDDQHNFDTEIILEAKKAGLKMVEIPVRTIKSKQISNNQLLRYALRSLSTLVTYIVAGRRSAGRSNTRRTS